MRTTLSAVAAVWIAAMSCGGGSAPPPPAPAVPVLSTHRIFYDDATPYRDSVRMVVRDNATWQDVWSRATSNRPSPPPLPAVDFSEEMVLLAAAGKMNAGDAIRIDSISVRGEVVVAVVLTITECNTFPGDVYPMEIVRVTKDDRHVEFQGQRVRAAHCNDY